MKNKLTQSPRTQKALEQERNYMKKQVNLLLKNEDISDLSVEQVAFALFWALPECQRQRQKDFSYMWDVSERTLSQWKHHPKIQKLRNKFMQNVLVEKTPLVLEALFQATQRLHKVTGLVDVKAIRLWLEYVEGWNPKQEANANNNSGVQVVFAGYKGENLKK